MGGLVEVEVEVVGLRIFRNLDLKLKDRGLLGHLVVVALVMVLSLLENLDLFLKEEGFRERDLMVGLGRGVVEVSSELEFLEKFKVRMIPTGATNNLTQMSCYVSDYIG